MAKSQFSYCSLIPIFSSKASNTWIAIVVPSFGHLYQIWHFKDSSSLIEFKLQEVGDDSNVCVLNILPKVSSLPSLLAINLVKIEIDFPNSHVTSCWSLDQRVMFRNLLHYVSTLPSVVSIHLLKVEVCIFFVTWPQKTTPLRCHAYIWVRAPCSMSPPWKVW